MAVKNEHKIFEDYLLRKGLKHSGRRFQILGVILKSGKHLTADQIYERVRKEFPSMGQATVYRTLKLLRECGICREVKLEDGLARYELLYGNRHHDHLICVKCGTFVEAMDPEIERLQEKLAKRRGFKVIRHKLELYGICPECGKKKGGDKMAG